MHGLVNRSIQCFITDTYGAAAWAAVTARAELGFDNFEAMLSYDTRLTERLVATAVEELSKSRESLLEDLGTYLVSHPNIGRLRRLLRFGGASFVDFLHSLDELPDRARLAVPDLDIPKLGLAEHTDSAFTLAVYADTTKAIPGISHVVMGILRAMADEYGALVLLEHHRDPSGDEVISIDVLEADFAAGRSFDLAVGG